MKNISSTSQLSTWPLFTAMLLHSLLIISLTVYTSILIPTYLLPTYIIFSLVFLASTIFSLNNIMKYQSGVFYYLLNALFLLGFWFKYSFQKITLLNYREPIGTFQLNSIAEVKVLWVSIYGILGFLLAQICSYYFFKKTKIKPVLKVKNKIPFKALIIITAFSFILALINLKFNILLLGLKPSLYLPIKGNAIYFLLLTRGMIFLFFLYCFRSYSNKMMFWGAFIASICSIGVLSRMIVLIYFAVIFIIFLQNINFWSFKNNLINFFKLIIIFILFSYLTVLSSSGLRNFMYEKESSIVNIQKLSDQNDLNLKDTDHKINSDFNTTLTKYFDYKQKAKIYIDLALGRWIGIEGVMAVESYPTKGLSLLWGGLAEKSYNGISFYKKISEPYYNNSNTGNVIATSVPGPIAFFYYSGSKALVFFALFVFCLILSFAEEMALRCFSQSPAIGIFIATFIVFDFFQFGISPLAFSRYFLFSFLSIAVLYYLIRKKILKGLNESN